MKLTFFLSVVTIFQLLATESYSQLTKLTLKLEDVKISDALKEIENMSEFYFLYSPKLIDVERKVNVDADQEYIKDILKDIFDKQVNFVVYNQQIILTPSDDSSLSESMQQQKITGIVTDSNGEPVYGVNVVITGTTQGTITDNNGKYSIEVPKGSKSLSFSFIGMVPQEIIIGTLSEINITMAESSIGLEDVVVIGYGTQQKRSISGSITNVQEKNFNTGVTRNAADLIQGKVAGLVITTASGDVTSSQSIRLRGTSSLTGSSEPFVVIDGVPGLSINSVSPQDVESISVLKDASSAAIYGSRSASGVILITTKKGKANQTSIDYNGYFAIDNVTNKPDVLTADEWRKFTSDNGMNTTGLDLGGNTDWFGEIMRTGITQNHDLSLSGGGNKSSYRASISYQDQEGIMKDNYQKRLNTRLAFTQKALNDKLNISLIGSINLREYQPTDVGNFELAYNMIPVIPVKLDDGSWYDKREAHLGNPVRNMEYNSNQFLDNSVYVNLKADLEIVRNLTAGINLYKGRGTVDNSQYLNSQTERGYPTLGYGRRSFSSSDKKLLETTLKYAGKTGNHSYGFMGGYSYEDNFSKGATAQNRLFVTDLFGSNNLSAGEHSIPGDASSWANMYKLISFFGRFNYSYLDRYILSATIRRDGSSKFGANNKWGTFPALSAAWRLSDEPFMQSLKGVLDELKIRIGYGVSGNQDGLAPYQSLQLFSSVQPQWMESGTYYDNGAWHTEYVVSQNANKDLRWEKSGMFNVGIDYSIFDGRINGTIEYYDKKTSDLLYNYKVPVPPYLYPTMLANVGTMQNKGIEFMIDGDIIRNKDLRWTASLNLAHNVNKITALSDESYTTSSILTGSAFIRGGNDNTTHIVEEGRAVGTFYGYRVSGLDANGQYIFDDMVDGVPGVTEADRTYIGNAQPKLTYGFSNTVTYKDFEFSFFLRGVYGNDVLNFSKLAYGSTLWLPGLNVLNEALTAGLKANPIFNSYYIEKASFLRMENLNFAYSIKPKNTLGINRIKVYLTAHNLFTLTKYSGLDPEVNMSGLDPGIEGYTYYPKSRSFILGVNLNF